MNFEGIKAIAKQEKRPVTDYIVLSRQNDPFYVGTPSDLENAAWFANLWNDFGYKWGVHLRRIHYEIVSQETPVFIPNGVPYENTEACWSFLTLASKLARYLNFVDPGAFVDRRNPQPRIFLYRNEHGPRIDVNNNVWGAADFPDFPDLPHYTVDNYVGEQRYHVELWCEKSTMNDVLIPLCSQYGVNLVTGLGEMSVTAVLDLTQRMNHKPVRIFYISDFDPAGQSMPCAVARKIEFFLQEHKVGADVKLFPIVLTSEQVRQYRLPRTPIKESEKRGARFEDRHGTGAVELDALEALHPGELKRVVEAEINQYFDRSLSGRVADAKFALQNDLEDAERAVIDLHSDDLDSLRAEYDEIRADFEDRMRSYGIRLRHVWHAIHGELEAATPDLVDYPIPNPPVADEDKIALFDAKRNYMTQLAAYKEWQGKSSGVEE